MERTIRLAVSTANDATTLIFIYLHVSGIDASSSVLQRNRLHRPQLYTVSNNTVHDYSTTTTPIRPRLQALRLEEVTATGATRRFASHAVPAMARDDIIWVHGCRVGERRRHGLLMHLRGMAAQSLRGKRFGADNGGN